MVTVRFYTRGGCHLCEIAEAVLRSEQTRTPFELNVIDIDTDPELQDLYGQLVPVTLFPDGYEMHYRVDANHLKSML